MLKYNFYNFSYFPILQGLELEALVTQAASDTNEPLEKTLKRFFCGLRVNNKETKEEDLPKRGMK